MMTTTTVRSRRVLAALCGLVLSGCVVTSENPLAGFAESEAIPAYLLGSWEFIEVATLDATGIPGGVVLEAGADGALRILLTERASQLELNASLATVGGMQVLSIAPRPGEDQWMLASIEFDESAEQLTVNFLSHAVLVEDIRSGRVQGEVYQFDQEELASLTASPEQLRTYLAAHGERAFSDRMAVLRKLPTTP